MEYTSKNRLELWLLFGKYLLVSSLVLIISTTTAYLVWSEGRIIPGISIGNIMVGGLKTREAAWLLSSEVEALGGQKVVLVHKNRPLSLVLNSIGIKIDVNASIQKAYQVGRSGPLWRRMVTRWRVYRHGYSLKPVFNNNQATLNSFFHLLEAGIAVEPVRSVVTVNRNGKVYFSSSRSGIVIDQPALTQKLEIAAFQRTNSAIEIPTKKVEPSLTENDITRWGLDQVLGIFTTKFDVSQRDRVNNLEIAASAINNVIVYPGQNFSFNTWVGPRVTEVGYKEAPVVYLGKLVPGVGGGVCQVSSTLYNAALLSNLKVVQRLNHSLPSRYVPLARDAAVVYGGADLIFENTCDSPILLVASVKAPYLTVAVLGRKSAWKKISLESKIIERYPFKTKITPDPALPKGTKLKVLNGQKGIKAELWRIIEYLDGSVKKELVNVSIYPTQPEEYKIGIKPE